MAFMDQEKKAKIAAELQKVMPAGWKYTLRVVHHSTLVLTIKSAPVDLIFEQDGPHKGCSIAQDGKPFSGVNEFFLESKFSGKLLEAFTAIRDAMNTGNHDNSDIQTDYFDVGHYISIKIGDWDKGFQYLPNGKPAAKPAAKRRVSFITSFADL